MGMLTFQISRAVRNAFWDRQGANKLLLYYNVIDIHIFHVFARSFLQNLINIYKECLLFRRVDVRYMSVGIEIVFTDLWLSLLMESTTFEDGFEGLAQQSPSGSKVLK